MLALSYLVRRRPGCGAGRGCTPQTLFKPLDYSKYPDYLQARTLRALRDAIAAGRDASTKPLGDKVIGFVAACFPHKRTAARTIDFDMYFFMDMIAYCRRTKTKSARLIYLAKEVCCGPGRAHLLCGGNDFMVGYIALASRTNKGNATEVLRHAGPDDGRGATGHVVGRATSSARRERSAFGSCSR